MDRTTQRMSMGAVNGFPIGQQEFTATGTFSFTVPNGVGSISAVCIGGGKEGEAYDSTFSEEGWGGGGGGLRWISSLAVTPGEVLTVTVGRGGSVSGVNAEDTSIKRGTTVLLYAGAGGVYGGAGSTIGGVIGGGDGGMYSGGDGQGYGGGGGGAGGYSGAGGRGRDNDSWGPFAGSGGGGGGGYNAAGYVRGRNGGGVGIYGEGASGAAGLYGEDGGNGSGTSKFGAGGGGGDNTQYSAGNGHQGACRIIWGIGRAYPSTRTANES